MFVLLVCRSVCPVATNVCIVKKTGLLNRDSIWGGGSGGEKEPCIKWSPVWGTNFCGEGVGRNGARRSDGENVAMRPVVRRRCDCGDQMYTDREAMKRQSTVLLASVGADTRLMEALLEIEELTRELETLKQDNKDKVHRTTIPSLPSPYCLFAIFVVIWPATSLDEHLLFW